MAIHDQMPWFPAWGMKFDHAIAETNEILRLFNINKQDENWFLLAFDAAASEKHLWTAWYSMRRNQKNNKMIAKSPDAEFIRLIAGTHQVKIAFNNMIYDNVPIGLTTKDARSTLLVNRDTLSRFKVSVNPHRKFVLSNWKEREDKTDATAKISPPETKISLDK
jgi:tRNA threonylcarbamoyladenosine modification (KEOPS) complex Cgi121 subunit